MEGTKARNRNGRGRGIRLLALLLGVCILFALGYTQLRPVVENAAAYQTRVFAARVLNGAILEELGGEGVGYGDLVRLTHNNSGDVAAIESDMAEINRLKAKVTQSVIDALEEMGTTSLKVPLGTLLGNELTAGRGPMVEIRVYPIGYVQTELYSQFTGAGINQTLHQIMLGAGIRMMAVIPGYSIQCDVSTSYCVAQTVIVGNIPEAYTQINEDTAPLISKINDYRAEN